VSYAVKEIFLTLQGEGAQAGRRAVFCRFAGCNLWSGLERDRSAAVCAFCDTDFVGMDGENGGRYTAEALAAKCADIWGKSTTDRFIVLTGGEPMLQVDDAIVDALHAAGFTIAMESNGTLAAHPGIDWLCISPKGASVVVQRSGDELKLVWPQVGVDPAAMEDWDFGHFLLQPMDMTAQCGEAETARTANAETLAAAMAYVMERPKWRLSLQQHKILGLA
jgi:7-carboxy-7-deazaguanine synthase